MPEKDLINQVIQYTPFLTMTTGGKPTLNFSRVIEALIIGAVVGLVASYMTVQRLEVKMDAMVDRIDTVEERTEKIYGDIYRPQIPMSGGGLNGK